MKIIFFDYKDIEDDDIRIEINFDLLTVKIFATTYNFKGETISKNKIVGWYSAKNKNRLFKILRNNIGNMGNSTRIEYLKFIDGLESE